MASIKAKIKVENANSSFGSYKLFYCCKKGANIAEKKGYLQTLTNLEALSSQIQYF